MPKQLLILSGAAVNFASSSLHYKRWYQTLEHSVLDNMRSVGLLVQYVEH